MDPEQSPDEGSSVFPMPIACTGCATRYKIDRPRGFTCPHCGNHIQVHGDGKVEIIPKKVHEMEIQEISELEEPPTTTPASIKATTASTSDTIATRVSSTSTTINASTRAGLDEEKQLLDQIEKPDLNMDGSKGSPEPEEQVMEIRASRKRPEPAVEPDPSIDSDQAGANNNGPIADAEEVDDAGIVVDPDDSQLALDEEIRREEAHLEELRKSRERRLDSKRRDTVAVPPPNMKDDTKAVAPPASEPHLSNSQPPNTSETGSELTKHSTSGTQEPPPPKYLEDKKEKLPPPVVPSYYGKRKKELRLPFGGDLRKNALATIIVIMLILVSIIVYDNWTKEDFTVQMPGEKIGDRGSYQVDGRIWASSSSGITSGTGLIRDLKIDLNGPMSYWINETALKKDGFGIERDTIDKYFNQDLQLSGSAELVTGDKLDISDAGSMKTKASMYTCLITNETIQNNITNDLDLNILTTYSLQTVDRGTYYPAGDTIGYNLFDLRERDYSLGDEGDFAGGQLRWKAEKKETVHKWDTIKLHITENNSGANWRQFSGDVWVANECSLPVKVHIAMKVDSTKLNPTLKLLFSLFTSSNGFLELDYTATMKGYSRGDKNIPWNTDPTVDDPRVDQRPGVDFDNAWAFAPHIRNDSQSFDPDFSPEFAAEYAVAQSSDLKDFVEDHEDEVYVVDGQYSRSGDAQYWRLMFGYRETGIATSIEAYNITIEKNGTEWDVLSDPGEEVINNPSNSRDEIEQAMNIADAEGIFMNMSYLKPLFAGDHIDFANEANGKIVFDIQNNYLHSGLSLTSSITSLLQNTVPSGYGYYLHRERQVGSRFYLEEGMIDAENGRVIYEIDHFQSGQF